jgi:23S rRNA (cytidine1920-2'-O)/16S rRNA (cytidine1409-2'-O)-methyltransferase
MRLDQWLVERSSFQSRSRAQAAIKAGLVRLNGVVAAKPSQKVAESDAVEVDAEAHPFVSRGGVKLEAALRAFKIDPAGKTCLDLGASTGGFTDALLHGDAAKIYAVDVGRDQLHETLRNDPRIISLEQTHAKDLSRALIPDAIDVIVCDVSFISLKKALPPALALAAPGAAMVALVKPQFEVGRARIGKGGIVKETLAEAAARDLSAWLHGRPGWRSTALMESPIRGGDGNREFLLGGVRTGPLL